VETILKLIQEALQENLETIVLMLIVVGSLNAVNIVLGTIVGTFTDKFDVKKFFFGILKAIIIGLCIFVFCYTLNLFALTLQLTKDITISADFISTVEVFTILIVWALDLCKDIIDKIKSMKQLKYVKYEDVQINPNTEEGIG
jgi:MFS family permease